MMKVGDHIYASNNIHGLTGRIVYGFCPVRCEYTDVPGTPIDPTEVIAIQVDDRDRDRVRLTGNEWKMEAWKSVIPLERYAA